MILNTKPNKSSERTIEEINLINSIVVVGIVILIVVLGFYVIDILGDYWAETKNLKL